MTTTTPTFTPVRQRRNLLAPLVFLLAVLAVGAGLWIALTSQRTTLVAAWARPVAAGQQIGPDDVTTMTVPANRPPALQGIADPALLIGQWTTRSVGQGELAYPAQVQAVAPTVPFYPNGETLPDGMVAVPFDLRTVGPVTDRDQINVNVIDPSGDPQRCTALGGTVLNPSAADSTTTTIPTTATTALPDADAAHDPLGQPIAVTCRLLPRMEILYVDGAAHIAFLAATPYQSQVIYTLTAQAGVQLYGERYGATAPALPYLTRMEPTTINPTLLTGPVSVTTPLLPGVWATQALPGAAQGQGGTK